MNQLEKELITLQIENLKLHNKLLKKELEYWDKCNDIIEEP
jgi:hypothetical protein